MVRYRRMIGKPGCDVVVGERQTATGTGRRVPGSAKAELVFGDRRLRRSPGIWRGRPVGDRQGRQRVVNLRTEYWKVLHVKAKIQSGSEWHGGAYVES